MLRINVLLLLLFSNYTYSKDFNSYQELVKNSEISISISENKTLFNKYKKNNFFRIEVCASQKCDIYEMNSKYKLTKLTDFVYLYGIYTGALNSFFLRNDKKELRPNNLVYISKTNKSAMLNRNKSNCNKVKELIFAKCVIENMVLEYNIKFKFSNSDVGWYSVGSYYREDPMEPFKKNMRIENLIQINQFNNINK